MRALKSFLKQFKVARDLQQAVLGPKSTPREIDLQAIEQFTLPFDLAFQESASAVQRIEGMFSPFSTAAVDMMLSFQKSAEAKGDILEIGTYKGKGAALLGRHLKSGERLTLVDIAPY